MPPTQSLTTPTAAVANATGEATFKWQGVPIGTNWVVAALVPLAPAAAVLTINENTSPVMSWIGASPSSTIEFAGGAIVSVSATGLTPGLTYRAMVRGQQYQGQPWASPPPPSPPSRRHSSQRARRRSRSSTTFPRSAQSSLARG